MAGFDDDWRPFESLVVNSLLEPRIVPFTPEQIAAGGHLEMPVTSTNGGPFVVAIIIVMLLVPIGAMILVVLGIRGRPARSTYPDPT